MFDTVALGELLIDFTPRGVGEQGSPVFEANPGGAPCNVLAALRRLGKSAAFIGKVGDDMFGRWLAETLRQLGIDAGGLITSEEYFTTLAFVKLDEAGNREFSFSRKNSADVMLRPEEVDAVVIAGMGGETIAQILAAAPWTREQDIPLVLQPMSSMSDLRAWLVGNGYCIQTEDLAREGDVLYTALLVRAGEMGPMTPAQLAAGANSPHPLRGAWLERWMEKTKRALEGLGRARQEGAAARREELEQVYAGLTEMKKEWDTWQL